MAKQKEARQTSDRCTWAINNFPRKLKNQFISRARILNMTGGNYLEYVVARFLREAQEEQKDV